MRLDSEALVHNWRTLDRLSGRAACGAAVKADGYGLGATGVAERLAAAGCRDFFVATWSEAQALAPLGLPVSVLHGVRAEDMPAAMAGFARPVLNTAQQIARWRAAGGGACDVMVDTGMNRLGVSPDEVRGGLLDGLAIETLMSHLASADEDTDTARAMSERQRATFAALAGVTGARRMSLANSAGIGLGADYAFDLTRPGLALYGGVPRAEMAAAIRQVVFPEAQVLQRRRVRAGESVGYNATWTAAVDTEVAIINLGYADGYRRAFSGVGSASFGEHRLPVLGRVSMDLVALKLPTNCHADDEAWVSIDYRLASNAIIAAVSQYELLTNLGARYDRRWVSNV
nr:alanine racemase [Sphingomonas sp. BT553]